MQFVFCRVGGVEGLLQVEGEDTTPRHPRFDAAKDLIDEFKRKQYNSGTLPGEIYDALVLGFWPKPLVQRLSKWTAYDGPGVAVAHHLFLKIFRKGGELHTVPPRMLDQRDRPMPPYPGSTQNGDDVWKAWAEHVARSWGRTPATPLDDFADVTLARSHYVPQPV
jgi:hypothetical protein